MTKYYLTFIIVLLFLAACGERIYSPYSSNIESRSINRKNLVKITERADHFSNSFKIAVISDSHDYYDALSEQVSYINKHKNELAFVIHTGDATNLGMAIEWEMFYDKISKLKIPYIMAIGNHDMLSNGEEIYKQLFGRDLNFSLVFKQTKFILYNNNNWESSGDAPNLNFIETELVNSTSVHDLLFGHVQADDAERYSSTEIDSLKALVDNYNVKYIINGHNHNYGTGIFGSATRITAGASAKGKLLILNISDSGVGYEFVTP